MRWSGQLGRACLAPNRSVENHVQKKSLFKSPSVPCLVRNRGVRPAHLSTRSGMGTWLEMRRYSTTPLSRHGRDESAREGRLASSSSPLRDAALPLYLAAPRRRRPGDPR